jgi:hypothetical protein
MNSELDKVTVIIDVEKAQREAVVLPDPHPSLTANTTATNVVSG